MLPTGIHMAAGETSGVITYDGVPPCCISSLLPALNLSVTDFLAFDFRSLSQKKVVHLTHLVHELPHSIS
jgi:hypothetical protein